MHVDKHYGGKANYTSNLVTRVSKQSMDWVGRRVNQLKVSLLSEVDKTWHKSAYFGVYKITWVT